MSEHEISVLEQYWNLEGNFRIEEIFCLDEYWNSEEKIYILDSNIYSI